MAYWPQIHLNRPANSVNYGRWAVRTPRLLNLVNLGVFSAVLALILLLITLTRLFGPPYVDPFMPYDVLLPGQPAGILESHGCHTPYETAEDGYTFCQIHPKSEPVLLITVNSRDGLIQQVTFALNDLRFADAVQHWGRPDALRRGKLSYNAHWDEGIDATATLSESFSFHAPLQTVTLSLHRTPPPEQW